MTDHLDDEERAILAALERRLVKPWNYQIDDSSVLPTGGDRDG